MGLPTTLEYNYYIIQYNYSSAIKIDIASFKYSFQFQLIHNIVKHQITISNGTLHPHEQNNQLNNIKLLAKYVKSMTLKGI